MGGRGKKLRLHFFDLSIKVRAATGVNPLVILPYKQPGRGWKMNIDIQT